MMYDGYVLDHWDHTASTLAMTQNLLAVVAGLFGGRVKCESPAAFHPYRARPAARDCCITNENFEVLKEFGRRLVR